MTEDLHHNCEQCGHEIKVLHDPSGGPVKCSNCGAIPEDIPSVIIAPTEPEFSQKSSPKESAEISAHSGTTRYQYNRSEIGGGLNEQASVGNGLIRHPYAPFIQAATAAVIAWGIGLIVVPEGISDTLKDGGKVTTGALRFALIFF